MAKRSIVKIDEAKCNGCGACVPSCAEGAIKIIDGKARLVAENLCDGLGACLGDCPEGAITVEERDADLYDVDAVTKHLGHAPAHNHGHDHGHDHDHGHGATVHDHGHMGGCPGSRVMTFDRPKADGAGAVAQPSELRQWPVQLHLVSPRAPYFQGADLLLAADCTAFAMGDFHARHLKGKALAVACPKLDDGQDAYLEKLVSLIDEAKVNTITVMIMEVPCCGGLERLAQEAAARASRKVPVKRVLVSLQGEVLSEDWI
jgi:NAD-dependent dihydropyrimidine dehydrogenase PreA subunit